MTDLKDKLIEAKNSFGEDAIHIIVDELNIEGWDDKHKQGICPFHTKDGEPESTPSFKWNPKDSAFKCFGCNERYGIVDHYIKNRGMSYRNAVKQLFSDTDTPYDFGETKLKNYSYPNPEQREDLAKTIAYLNKRKISENTIRTHDVAQDMQGNIVFEYYDQNDTLLTSKYRPSYKVEKGNSKNWSQKDADTTHILWNMNRVSFDKPLHISEGEIDALALIEVGITNSVSIPFGAGNTHWIEENWNWLDQFSEIILCADNDEAGEKLLNEAIPRLGEWRCKTITYPMLPTGEVSNDLNEILYYLGGDQLYEIIEAATDVPITNVADLADIPDIDLSKAMGIKSGIKELDKRIAKFYMGTLSIWTGINGSGKSTLLNQVCVAEPTNQGFKSFLFSGELSPSQLRNWIEYPMAGGANIEEHKVAEDQPTFFKVKPSAKEMMREWYRGQIYIYTDEIDRSAKTLIDKMEVMARKYGVKNFMIDNLMTVDISSYRGDSDFVRQKLFAIDLLRFAIKYQVVVHLVAHPRKLDFIKRLTKMDVSGSGDLTNLAHYVLAVHRVTPAEKEGVINGKGDVITEPVPFDAILDLFKNRPIGFQDVEFGLDFDRKSKRFYKDNNELYKQYGWDNATRSIPETIIDGDEEDLPI
jgi:twinkle protein